MKIFPEGFVYLDPLDNCDSAALALETIGYREDLCIALDFNPEFVARLMAAGFLVMSCVLEKQESAEPGGGQKFLLLPKHHILRSCLFFPELHIKKTIRSRLSGYELRFDSDFDTILDKCVLTHGDDWLTPPLLNSIKEIRKNPEMPARPVSFGLYREGRLAAGEFGVVAGRVYTSYSGYYEEDNAGTIQMILTSQYLEKNGFSFWDLGMPLDYKKTLGAREISRQEFMELFRT